MLVVVDTNVLWQAFHNPKGISGEIIKTILLGELRIALSDPVILEYEDVLLRPSSLQKFGAFSRSGKWFQRKFRFRPNLRDEADNMFVELAITSSAHYLITNNMGDFTRNADLMFDDLRIITPKDFIQRWRSKNEQ